MLYIKHMKQFPVANAECHTRKSDKRVTLGPTRAVYYTVKQSHVMLMTKDDVAPWNLTFRTILNSWLFQQNVEMGLMGSYQNGKPEIERVLKSQPGRKAGVVRRPSHHFHKYKCLIWLPLLSWLRASGSHHNAPGPELKIGSRPHGTTSVACSITDMDAFCCHLSPNF